MGAGLTKFQARAATLRGALSGLPPPSDAAQERASRARALAAVGRARVANAWLRIGGCAVVAAVAASLIGTLLPFLWFAGLVAVVLIDRAVFKRLAEYCNAGVPPPHPAKWAIWAAGQNVYGNIVAAMLWFAPYVPGETLAVMYLCAALANAAATLRTSPMVSAAAVTPTVLFLLGLPLADFLVGGGVNTLELAPLIGALLLLAYGVNVWRSLLASDAAQAQAEAAVLRERQAAAAAAAAKTQMIQRMNDELRTPMQALIGAAEHLRRAAATPQARAHIAMLAQSGEVLKLVLDDLSDLDRLENGRLRIEPKAADPRQLARAVVNAFRVAAQDKGLELFLDVAPETPALVEIDALRVRQVLFNLLANAVHYTTHGGVRVRLYMQPCERPGAVRLCFDVADTGAGLSRSQIALIFGATRQGSPAGEGLGLAISLRLARLMDGQIEVKSELGEGSVFSFTLVTPVSAARSSAA